MGELNVVLNGIEFRTRHNDYRLRMPSKTKKDYNLMEYIDFPPVPPAVLNKKTVHEQVLEMREWFRGTKVTMCGSRGRGRGSGPPPPENHRNIVFSMTGPDPLVKLPSQHSLLGRIGTPAKRHLNGIRWRANDGPLIVVFGSFLPHQTKKNNNK